MLSEASGAVAEMQEDRSHRPPGNGNGSGTAARFASVEHRVDIIEQHIGLLPDLMDAVGTHRPGEPPTGIYKLIHDLGERLSWWEKLRERAIGALWVGVPIVGTAGGLLWWFAGKQIAKAFGVPTD